MREVVERETGCLAVFLQGASGELAPAWQYVGDPAVADRRGARLGHAVLATLYGMNPPGKELVFRGSVKSGAPLAVWAPVERRDLPDGLASVPVVVELPLRPELPTEETLMQALEAAGDDRVVREQLLRKLRARKPLGNGAGWRRVAVG